MSQFDDMVLNMTQTTPEPEDYTGEDGLFILREVPQAERSLFPGGQGPVRA